MFCESQSPKTRRSSRAVRPIGLDPGDLYDRDPGVNWDRHRENAHAGASALVNLLNLRHVQDRRL
jgi:hypothetical protein